MWQMHELPTLCPLELRATLRVMLGELSYQRLEVGLVPAWEQRHAGHSIRAVFCRNPGWYRDLCAAFPRRRRRIRKERFADPRFKRADVAAVLQRLLSTGSRSYLAGPLLTVAARQRLANLELSFAVGSLCPVPVRDPAAWPYDILESCVDPCSRHRSPEVL